MPIKIRPFRQRDLTQILKREPSSRAPPAYRAIANKPICAKCRVELVINEQVVVKSNASTANYKTRYYHPPCAHEVGLL